jgi:toxin ParE1/3/4
VAPYNVDLDARAIEDLARIRDYLAEARGRPFADQYIARIFDHFSGFEITPFRGLRRDDIKPGLRVVGWRKTLSIAFTVDEATTTVMIAAVIYRGRDVDKVLRERTV